MRPHAATPPGHCLRCRAWAPDGRCSQCDPPSMTVLGLHVGLLIVIGAMFAGLLFGVVAARP